MNNFIFAASNVSISELKSNRKYMSVSMEMFSTKRNLNGVAVTEAFIDDIVANKNDYVCMTLAADVSKLKKKDYRGLTHMYDPSTGSFLAEEIGSFYDFEKIKGEDGESTLVGYARINKRSNAVCEAVQELYEKNALAFSFEIAAGNTRAENGVTIIDASEENELTAMAIVSVPAYPDSKAISLVAEAEMTPETFFASANILISEIDFDTVRRWLWDAMHDFFGDHIYDTRPLLVGVDFALIYDERCGKTMKFEYVLNEEGNLLIKDVFDVEFVRAEQNKDTVVIDEMEQKKEAEVVVEQKEEVSAEVAEVITPEVNDGPQIETAEEKKEDDSEQEPEAFDEEAQPDPEEPSSEEKDAKDVELAEALSRCSALEAEVAELKAFKEELDVLKAEKEQAMLAEKRERISRFAKESGLNPESEVIAKAIQNLDYEVLISEAMANKENHANENAAVYRADFNIKPTGTGFSYLFEKKKN